MEFTKNQGMGVPDVLCRRWTIEEVQDLAREEGREEGQKRMSNLTLLLKAENRIEDIFKAAEDPDYQDVLFKEFGL